MRSMTTGIVVSVLWLNATPGLGQEGEPSAAQREHEEQIPPQDRDDLREARDDVRTAAGIVKQLLRESEMLQLMGRSKGIFVIPDYATAALIAGAAGGKGVLLSRQGRVWSGPAFYDVGGLSVGAQAGVAAGSIAMLLLSQDAVDRFKEKASFSLTAEDGLTLVDWALWAQGETRRGGDIVVWADMKGLVGEAALGLSGVSWDEEENRAYYGQTVTAGAIMGGRFEDPYASELKQLLDRAAPGD